MPLTRGEAVGYDADLMVFKFTMRNGEQIVQCQISRAAIGDLADRWRGAGGTRGLNLRRIASLSRLSPPNSSTKLPIRKRGWFAFFRNTFRAAPRKSKNTHQDSEPGGAFGEAKTGPAESCLNPPRMRFALERAWFQKGKQIINLGAVHLERGCCTSDTAVATNCA